LHQADERPRLQRLVRKAIQYAIDNGRESVTLGAQGKHHEVHGRSLPQLGLQVAREEFGNVTITEEQLYAEYKASSPKQVVIKDRIADIMFQIMLLRPDEFDVLPRPT